MLSVIIPAYRMDKLQVTLQTLAKQKQSHDVEFILVGDGIQIPIDCLKYGLNIINLCNPRVDNKNHNVGACRNLGVSKAHGDVFLFLDEDTIPEFDAFQKFKNICKDGISVTGITRRGKFGDFHWFPNPQGDACEFYGFSAITRSDFEKVGGFYEDFYGWGAEDECMNWKVIQFGIRRICDSKIKAYHQEHSKVKNQDEQQLENYALLLEKTGYRNINQFWAYCRKHIEWVGF